MAGPSDIRQLVRQLAESVGDAANEQAARSLGALASEDADSRDAIVQAGGVPALVTLIRSTQIHEAMAVLQPAAAALASLLRSSTAAQAAMQCTALPTLVRMLQYDPESVQLEAARALRNMAGSASGQPAIKDSIYTAGALSPLFKMLRSTSPACRQEAALALG